MLKSLLTVLCLIIASTSHAFFWSSEPASLKELAVGVASEMKEKAGTSKKLYLDKVNVKDSVSGETSNLSAYLVNELQSALSAAGFVFSDFMEQADLAVGAGYQKDGKRLRVFIKYCQAKDGSDCKTLAAALPLEKLPKDSFEDSLDNRLNRLVMKAVGSNSGLKLFINPVIERKGRYASEFSEFVTTKARTALVNSQLFDVLDEQPVVRLLSNTRGLAVKAKDVKNLESSAALFSGADTVLEGYYLEAGGKVTLALTLKDLNGTVLGSADDTIARELIPYSTTNPIAGDLSILAGTSGQMEQRMVKLNSTKGDRYQFYRAGEKVQFLVQTARPLFVYLFAINEDKQVVRLYPGPFKIQERLESGMVHIVPGDRDDWEIVVEPPFGTDIVKLFASDKMLRIPHLSGEAETSGNGYQSQPQKKLTGQKIINGADLVDYFRAEAELNGAALYEDSLFVQTRPR